MRVDPHLPSPPLCSAELRRLQPSGCSVIWACLAEPPSGEPGRFGGRDRRARAPNRRTVGCEGWVPPLVKSFDCGPLARLGRAPDRLLFSSGVRPTRPASPNHLYVIRGRGGSATAWVGRWSRRMMAKPSAAASVPRRSVAGSRRLHSGNPSASAQPVGTPGAVGAVPAAFRYAAICGSLAEISVQPWARTILPFCGVTVVSMLLAMCNG